MLLSRLLLRSLTNFVHPVEDRLRSQLAPFSPNEFASDNSLRAFENSTLDDVDELLIR